MKREQDDLVKEEQESIVDGSLFTVVIPEEFRKSHEAKFNEAMAMITKIDPTLIPVFLKSDFDLYMIPEEDEKKKVDEKLQEMFSKLGGAIIAQQISNAAAKSIRNRFKGLFDDKFPLFKNLNEYVKEDSNKKLMRECGLSLRKVQYMESLASYFTLNESKLTKMYFEDEDNDDKILEDLVSGVKGIGPWSAKMFLVSGLKRYDIFAPEDLGIARGFSNYMSDQPDLVKELMSKRREIKKSKVKHKKNNWKIYDLDIMEACAERFAPYRSVFMFLLWRLSGNNKMDVSVDVEKQFVNQL